MFSCTTRLLNFKSGAFRNKKDARKKHIGDIAVPIPSKELLTDANANVLIVFMSYLNTLRRM